MKEPQTYLSISENAYRIIHQGMPLCADKRTAAEAMAVARFYKCNLPDVAWNGDRAEWVHMDTIE